MISENYRSRLKKCISLLILFLLYPFIQTNTYSNEEYSLKSVFKHKSSIPLFTQQQNESLTSYVINPYYIKMGKDRLIHSENIFQKKGVMSELELVSFLTKNNRELNKSFAKTLVSSYIEGSEIEGINHDVVFAQMCLETGYLKFGGSVLPSQNNFCGLGAVNAKSCGESFDSVELGVRAHIQHLKAYTSKKPLQTENVDPRFKYVDRGSVNVIDDLTGRWATDPEYGLKIKSILETMYSL